MLKGEFNSIVGFDNTIIMNADFEEVANTSEAPNLYVVEHP